MADDSDDIDFEEKDIGGPSRAWFVELTFWRPSALTDEEIGLFFPGRDGKWSDQTKEAIKRHGAKGLDLNQNWALVPRNWVCPVCNRSKVDIFRLSNRGILLANVEEHHDHLRDYVSHRARQLFGERWTADLPGSGMIADTLEELVSSFPSELVCSECNAADGKAKLLLKDVIPSYFSFAPGEIKQFIIPTANADHQIDSRRVEETWRGCEPSLKERIKLIDQALHMIRDGMLYRERGTSSFRASLRQFEPQYQLYQEFLRKADRDERGRELRQTMDEFLARSVQKDSHAVIPRPGPRPATASGPTDAEYSGYCDPVSPRRWKATGEGWSCPICDRTKRQVTRKANGGKWTGGIRELIEPIQEADEAEIQARRSTLPGFSHAFVMKGSRSVLICSDCLEIISQIKLRRRDITDIYLTGSDLRQCILSVQPHAPHDVDWDEVARRALSNRSIGSAWEAYSKHRSLASRLRHIFKVMALNNGGEQRAMDEIAEEVMFTAELDDRAEAYRLAKWFLREAARFDDEEDRRKAAYIEKKSKKLE